MFKNQVLANLADISPIIIKADISCFRTIFRTFYFALLIFIFLLHNSLEFFFLQSSLPASHFFTPPPPNSSILNPHFFIPPPQFFSLPLLQSPPPPLLQPPLTLLYVVLLFQTFHIFSSPSPLPPVTPYFKKYRSFTVVGFYTTSARVRRNNGWGNEEPLGGFKNL